MADEKKQDKEQKEQHPPTREEARAPLSKPSVNVEQAKDREQKHKKISVEVKKIPPSVLLGQESPYFALAVKALEYAQSFVVKGSTELANNQRSPEELAALYTGIIEIRHSIKKEADRRWRMLRGNGFPNENELYRGLYSDVMIEMIKKSSLGNCSEVSFLIMDFCHQNNFNGLAEIYDIERGDHEFVVIGRDPNSDPNDINTWGKNALVCDPWSNKIYPVSEIGKHLEDFRWATKQTEEGRIADFKLRPINTQTQGLSLVCSLTDLRSFRDRYKVYCKDVEELDKQFVAAVQQQDAGLAMQLIEQGVTWKPADYAHFPQLRALLETRLQEAIHENNITRVDMWLAIDDSLITSVDNMENSLLDLAFLQKNTEIMKILLTMGVNWSASKNAGELLFTIDDTMDADLQLLIDEELLNFMRLKLQKSSTEEIKGNKLFAGQKLDFAWFLNYLSKHPDRVSAVYTRLMCNSLNFGALESALTIFSAFSELRLNPHYFEDNYLAAIPGNELLAALQVIMNYPALTKEARHTLKCAIFNDALHHADREIYRTMLELFKDDPHFINLRDSDGNTPLHIAADEDNIYALRFLLNPNNERVRHVDPFAVNLAGQMPYELARSTEAAQLLQQAASVKKQEMDVTLAEVEWRASELPPSPINSPPSSPPTSPRGGVSSFFPSGDSKRLESKKEEKKPKEERKKITHDSGQDKQPYTAPESSDPTNRNK